MTKLAEEPKAAAELDAVRKIILDRSAEMRLSLTDLSRAAGRNDAYVHQFIWRGSPKRLPEAERAAIAAALQVPAAALRLEYSPRSGDAGKAALPPPVFPPYRPATQPDHGDIPVYVEGGPFDPDKTAEWTPRPGTMAGGNGLAAVWVARDHGRVRAGDMLYVRETQPPAAGRCGGGGAGRRHCRHREPGRHGCQRRHDRRRHLPDRRSAHPQSSSGEIRVIAPAR